MPQPAKPGQVNIPDVTSAKRFCEILAVELRIAPGFGNRTHVHDLFHLMSREQVKEFLDRVGGVADCENWASHSHSIALSFVRFL